MRHLFASAVLVASFPTLLMAQAAMPTAAPAAAPAAMPAPAAAAKPAPWAMAGYIAIVEGSVQVQLGGSDVWALAKPGQQLPAGSQIKTQAGSSCTVGFTDGTKVRVGPNGSFKLEEMTNTKVAVFIGLGKLENWVSKWAKRTFQARNPVSVASVRGTVFQMDVLSPTSVTTDCFSGSLAVTDNFGRTTAVEAGQRVEANAATGSAAPAPLPPDVTAPAEPPVSIPELASAAAPTTPLEAAPPADAPADEVPADETTITQPEPAPVNPVQETSTSVSPSSP